MKKTMTLDTPENYLATYRAAAIRDSRSDRRPNVAYYVIRFPAGQCASEQRFDGYDMFPKFAAMGAVDVECYRKGKQVA